MMQAHPVPDVHASGSLAVEDVTCSSVAVLGAREGTNQIQLRACIDDPADAAQNAIHLSKCPESIDVHGLKARSLQQKFLVVHATPRNKPVSSRGLYCVGEMTQSKRNHAQASSRFFARGRWSILITASHYQFVAPARDEAPAVTLTPPPSRVTAGVNNSSSCGGVEVRHAKTGNMPGSVPGGEMSSSATSLERTTVQGAALEPCAGVTPGPQDSIPEAGPCGFSFDINSIPDFARRS